MALIREYFELCTKYHNEYGDKTILLMQVGSFYECYGIKCPKTMQIKKSKIMDFSHICELNVVGKNTCVGEEHVVMAGFKVEFLEKYLRKIQEAGYTCVVYKQDESGKNTTRSLEGIYSPGTYFSNDSTNLTNNLTCIWVESINNKFTKGKVVIVGMSNVDIFTGKTNIFEYKENYLRNPTTFDELERFISIYNPSEVILISNLTAEENDDIINYVNIRTNSIHLINVCDKKSPSETKMLQRVKNCEKQTYQKEILSKFFKIADFDVFFQNFYNNPIATQSFCYLLDFVYQHNPHLLHKIAEPFFDNFSDRMILANHSLKQLNIIDDNNYTGKYSSVLKMLNACLTPMGKRKFTGNFLNPTTNVDYLQNEYDIIDYMLRSENYEKYNVFLRENLSQIKDLSKWEREIFIKKITPKTFYNLHKNIKMIQNVFEFVKTDPVIMKYLQNTKIDTLRIQEYCENICNYIETNINLQLAKDCDQEDNFYVNFFNFGIDPVLDEKTEIIKYSEEQLECIRLYLNSIIKNKEKSTKATNTEYVKIYETEKNNYTLIATNRRCKLLDDGLPKEEEKIQLTSHQTQTQTKSFGFTVVKKGFEYNKQSAANCSINNQQINSICKTITSTKIMMKDLISLAFNKFVENFGEQFQIQLEYIIDFITIIDMLYAKSHISKKYNYCKPNIVGASSPNGVAGQKSFLEAKNIRHCLIEHLQTNEYYVTNDVTLGNGEVDGILLYGTNAVGKTSLIRAIGIAVIMAQSGLFVPCSEFNFVPYKYIFTRILGNDNLFKGLSTFAVEMSELRTILRCANENSLILGDELCSGTEIASAISIFVAGIQKMNQCKSSYIFATHLHEIVNYDEITCIEKLKIKHMSVVYDKENDCLVYDRKLKDGPGNCMYGLEVCKSLSLPMEFMENAYNIRMKYNKEMGECGGGSILSLKESHFNSKKLMGLCENCGVRVGTEVHHLQHQAEADDKGYINNKGYKIHKNNPANLLTLCEKCHDGFHSSCNDIGMDTDATDISVLSELSDVSTSKVKKQKQHRKVKTTKGIKLQEV
jgi:DNA mismatch repair protein MutS